MKTLILILMMLPVYFSFGQADSTINELHEITTVTSDYFIVVADGDTNYHKISLANLLSFFDVYYTQLSDSNIYATQYDLTTGLAAKQATLVSGTNIKTVNSTTLLGSGDLAVSSDTTGFWAIVNNIVTDILADSDTLLATAATLDSLTIAFWNGTLSGFDSTFVYQQLALKLPTATYNAFIGTLTGGSTGQALAKIDGTNYNWTWATIGTPDLSDNTPPIPPVIT